MDEISKFDKIVIENVYKKCADKDSKKYPDIAKILDVSESFVKAVFSENRRKLNLYHLLKFTYELKCDINDFLPTLEDYKKVYKDFDKLDEYECFLKSINVED